MSAEPYLYLCRECFHRARDLLVEGGVLGNVQIRLMSPSCAEQSIEALGINAEKYRKERDRLREELDRISGIDPMEAMEIK